MDKPTPRAYRFGNFRVDLQRQELTGPGGASLNLSARAYDVLIFLLENRNRVVGKDEMMKAVWPTTVVEENNLNQAVTMLRRALGDRRDAPQFVRTIAGRGYRFVGEVSEEDARATTPSDAPPVAEAAQHEIDSAPDSRQRRLLLGLGLAAVAAGGAAWFMRSRPLQQKPFTRVRSLAVLPFRPLIADAGDAVLEFGLTNELITRLSSLPDLIVRPFSSVRSYASRQLDPVRAGRELDVDAVVDGFHVIRANRVRVTAQLLDVATGRVSWGDNFEEPFDELFTAQDRMVGQIASALQIKITDYDRQRLLDRPTNDVEAWREYMTGRLYWELKTPDAFHSAIEHYQAAEKLDPAFALAVAGQADSWAVLGVYNAVPPAQAFARAAVAAERALVLAPDLPEALAAMGHVLVQGRRQWSAGERLYRQALAAKPGFAQCRMWLANDCAYQGRLREALVEASRAHELEPVSLTFAANVGLILYLTRDYSAAIRQLEPIVEVAPEFPLARQHLARTLIASGDPEKALALIEGRTSPGPAAHAIRGCALAGTGRRDLATAEIRGLEQKSAQGFGVAFDMTLIHAALGDSRGALDALELAARDGSQQLGFLNSEPGLDPIRNEPRFRAVSRQVGLG